MLQALYVHLKKKFPIYEIVDDPSETLTGMRDR